VRAALKSLDLDPDPLAELRLRPYLFYDADGALIPVWSGN
jgi:hypothetical protein